MPTRRGDMQALFEGRMHYIRNGDGTEELYDFEADPREENDLLAERPDVVARSARCRGSADQVARGLLLAPTGSTSNSAAGSDF